MWRFVHLTDTHLGSRVDGQWNNRFLCSIMPDVMRCLRRDLARLKPEFLLITGDITSQQSRDAMFAARDLLDDLKFPYYPLGGNHDFMTETSREWFMEAFETSLPNGDTVYSFTYRDLHFCALDPWWKWDDGTLCPFSEFGPALDGLDFRGKWAVPPHEFAWLEEDLEHHRNLPTIIAVHYPAVPIPDRIRRPGMKDAGHLENGDILLEIISRNPQVKAVFAGHVHIHFIHQRDGVTHVATGALPEFPVEYREVDVYPDRLEVFTKAMSDASFAAQTLLPGNDWTAGQPADRAVTIPLS